MKLQYFALLPLAALLIHCKSQYPDLENGLFAEIETSKGTILLKLENEKTPLTVANFVSLSEGTNPMVSPQFKNKKYYDGILFHRVIADFMIQGGDPTATGSGGPGYQFEDEITDLKHDSPGILSMANAGPGTNGSQFFITHKATPWLDGKHTVFGKVVKGQNVVDSIAQNDTIKTIVIIRKGRDAKKFDAPQLFTSHFETKKEVAAKQAASRAKIQAKKVTVFERLKPMSKTTSSGLKYLVTEKGKGAAVNAQKAVGVHYAVYFVDGTLLDTSILSVAEAYNMVDENRKMAGKYSPLPAEVGPDARLIEGFKEGLRLLSIGDKATLFLPYTLAYGDQGGGPIPPKSDLIFEVEIVEAIND